MASDLTVTEGLIVLLILTPSVVWLTWEGVEAVGLADHLLRRYRQTRRARMAVSWGQQQWVLMADVDPATLGYSRVVGCWQMYDDCWFVGVFDLRSDNLWSDSAGSAPVTHWMPLPPLTPDSAPGPHQYQFSVGECGYPLLTRSQGG